MGIKVLASGSSGNCYLLETQNETLILECGISFKEIKKGLNFDLSKVVGCLVSHEHGDHCKAILEVTRSAIPTYSSNGTFKAIPTDELSTYNRHELKHRRKKLIGGFTVLPFDTEHDVNEPLGFLIEHKELGKIVFITDSYYCIYKFGNVDHILIECNYSEDILDDLPPYRARVLKSHMSLETLKDTIKTWDLSNTKDITLIHISEGNGDPERFRREIEALTGIKTYVAVPELKIE